MKRMLFGISFLLLSSGTMAASVSHTSKVKSIYTYGTSGTSNTQYRNDVVINVETTVPGCEDGYWIKAEDTMENPSLVSVALSAFHAGSKLYIAAYTDQLWTGSNSGRFCRVHSIGLTK